MRHRIFDAGASSAPVTRIYSVPRRLDLASLFVFTMCYGILFAVMSAFRFEALSFALVAGFLTCVGVSQAMLFGGKAPRFASSISGTLYYGVFFVVRPFLFGTPGNRLSDIALIPFLVFGMALGYLSGVCIAGIFLITELLRKRLRTADQVRSEE